MSKLSKSVFILVLILVSFFLGVSYSDSVKEHAGWLFEQKEEEIELPDMSQEKGAEFNVEGEENFDGTKDSANVANEEVKPVAQQPAATPANSNAQ